jgi:hypothetical protein
MSIKVMTRVWEHAPQKGSQLLLLLALADFANDDSICWPGTPRLAQKIRMSQRQTQRMLDALIAAGALAYVPGNGRNHSAHYAVLVGLTPDEWQRVIKLLGNDDKMSPLPSTKGDKMSPSPKGDISQRVTFSQGKGDISGQERVTSSRRKVSSVSPVPLRQTEDALAEQPSCYPSEEPSCGGGSRSWDSGGAAPNAADQQPPPPASLEKPEETQQPNAAAEAETHDADSATASPPPHSAPPPSPPDASAALVASLDEPGRAWLKAVCITTSERRRLASAIATYGAEWARLGIGAAADQGGRTLKYLERLLEGCKAEGTTPGSPRSRGTDGRAARPPRAAPPPDETPEQFAARVRREIAEKSRTISYYG